MPRRRGGRRNRQRSQKPILLGCGQDRNGTGGQPERRLHGPVRRNKLSGHNGGIFSGRQSQILLHRGNQNLLRQGQLRELLRRRARRPSFQGRIRPHILLAHGVAETRAGKHRRALPCPHRDKGRRRRTDKTRCRKIRHRIAARRTFERLDIDTRRFRCRTPQRWTSTRAWFRRCAAWDSKTLFSCWKARDFAYLSSARGKWSGNPLRKEPRQARDKQ